MMNPDQCALSQIFNLLLGFFTLKMLIRNRVGILVYFNILGYFQKVMAVSATHKTFLVELDVVVVSYYYLFGNWTKADRLPQP